MKINLLIIAILTISILTFSFHYDFEPSNKKNGYVIYKYLEYQDRKLINSAKIELSFINDGRLLHIKYTSHIDTLEYSLLNGIVMTDSINNKNNSKTKPTILKVLLSSITNDTAYFWGYYHRRDKVKAAYYDERKKNEDTFSGDVYYINNIPFSIRCIKYENNKQISIGNLVPQKIILNNKSTHKFKVINSRYFGIYKD